MNIISHHRCFFQPHPTIFLSITAIRHFTKHGIDADCVLHDSLGCTHMMHHGQDQDLDFALGTRDEGSDGSCSGPEWLRVTARMGNDHRSPLLPSRSQSKAWKVWRNFAPSAPICSHEILHSKMASPAMGLTDWSRVSISFPRSDVLISASLVRPHPSMRYISQPSTA